MRALIVGLLIGVIAGVHVGSYLERTQQPTARSVRGVPVTRHGVARPPLLRCAQRVTFDGRNQPTVRTGPYTRVDAEAATHHARVALETARRYSGSMPHKQAWALEAIAGYLDVLACGWGE